jgi:hypothetical protein
MMGTMECLARDLTGDQRLTVGEILKTGFWAAAVTPHSIAEKCARGSRDCTQFPKFAELAVLNFRAEIDALKK